MTETGKDLGGLLSRMADTRVLCAGDIMLDRYVYGQVERISPEGPIPVLRIERETSMLGGVGNVAANLTGLGATARVIAVVGNDSPSERIHTRLQDLTGDDRGLIVDAKRPTTIKTRFLASGQQLLRADNENGNALPQDVVEKLIVQIEKGLADADILVLSDYGKGVLCDDVLTRAIQCARQLGKKVVVDPKGSDYTRYRGASVVTPNRKELAQASGRACGTDDEIVAAARHVMERCGIDSVLATRSQDGMTVVTQGEEPVHLRTEVREVYDVSGAGDTVVAAIAAALATGAGLADAAALANVAGGIVVGKVGTAIVRSREIDEVLRRSDRLARSNQGRGAARIMTQEEAVEQVARWRQRGLRIGFTNGCFDLLHPGHISLLNQAREQCDRLIVGLNSDDSIRRLKGEGRPAQVEDARATVLGSIASVDLIVIFGEDTPIDLIKALSPDVLVKGSDYTVDRVVGADYVMSYGGKVFLAEIEKGHSTTSTIKRIVATG